MSDQRATSWQHRKWVSLLTNLVILVCLMWFLYTPKRPSYEQLAAIRLGMTLEEAQCQLAPARALTDYALKIIPVFTPPGDPKLSLARSNLGIVTSARLQVTPASALKPRLIADVDTSWMMERVQEEIGDGPDGRYHHLWLGRDHLLWVRVDERGVVDWIHLLPIREEGGGVLAWLQHRYRTWSGRPASPVVVTAPAPARK